MSIYQLKQSKMLHASFKRFGRAGLSERVLQIAKELTENPSYFKAIHAAGQIRALAIMSHADSYWDEKESRGFEDEAWWIEHHRAVIEKDDKGEVLNVTFEKQQEQAK